MGFRSHFVIREGSALRRFASHWGGYRLLRDLLHGPAIFGAYVEALRPSDDLFYGDSVDGVAFVDRDRRALQFWGGDNLEIESVPGLRRRYLELLGRVWSGWEVRWAPGGIDAIEGALGLPPSSSPARELRLRALLDDALRGDEGPPRAVITLVDGAGAAHDVVSGFEVDELLSLGPRLCDELRRRPASPLPRESIPPLGDEDGWSARGGLVIEVATARIGVWWSFPSRERIAALTLLARFWPGWTLDLEVEGLVAHAERSGRPRGEVELPLVEAAAALEERLFGVEDVDLPAVVTADVTRLLEERGLSPGTELAVAAGVFGDRAGLPHPTAIRGQIAALLAGLPARP